MRDEILDQIDKLSPELKSYFEQLFQIESRDFLKTSKIVTIKANERFVSTGGILDRIWICISGVVKVMEEFRSGEIYIFTKFSAPEIFGEMEALAEIPKFRASLVAETDCVFIVGSVEAYKKWVKSDAKTLYERTRHLLKGVMDEGRSNRAYLLLDGMERIKLYFIDHYVPCENDEPCILKNTRQQISDETGYSVKTVNRVIKKLSEQEFLIVKGQRIIINNTHYKKMLESMDEKVKYE